jgi:peptide-methionine (S)-S-oxide reductase
MEINNEQNFEFAVLGGGCFWCLEAAYQEISGVEQVVSGYTGGQVVNPTYEAVCSGTTGHAEVVKVKFDPKIISYSDVLDIFWAIHNPTTLNRQGHDTGSQYRSIILYGDEIQHEAAKLSIIGVSKLWTEPIVTELLPLAEFFEAEPYHQDYFKQHPEAAYCQIVINPKLLHLRQAFAARLKPEFK